MNPYLFAAFAGAANASQRRRNGHKSSDVVRRRVVIRARPRRNSPTTERNRRSVFVRGAITIALAVALIVGLILFSFAV